MPDPLSPVVAGQPLEIRASAWNAIVSAARAVRQGERGERDTRLVPPNGCVVALGFNDTGADLPRFKPAKVSGTGPYTLTSDGAASDWSRRPVVTLDTPGAATDMVAVTLEAIPDGQFGRVAVAGWCACDVDVSDSGHGYASPTTDTDALVSGATGSIRIINAGTGTAKRTAVYLGDQISGGGVGGITFSEMSSGGLGTVAITGSTDVYSTVLSVTAPATGIYLLTYTMTAALTASVSGASIYTRFKINSTSLGSTAAVQCYIPVNGQRNVQTVSNTRYYSLTNGDTVAVEAARHFPSGSISESNWLTEPNFQCRMDIVRVS